MATTKRVLEIEVKNQQAKANLEEVNDGLKEADKNVDNLTESLEDLESQQKENKTTSKDFSKDLEDNAESMGILDKATGGMASQLLNVFKGMKTVTSSSKALKIALISTGIGAIAVAVGTLAAAFLSTEEGMDKVNKVLIPLGETLETVWGVFQDFSNGMFTFLSGDFQKGWDEMGTSIEDVGDKLGEAYKRGKELYDLQLQIRGLNQNEDLVVARLRQQAVENKLIAEDINKSDAERVAALERSIAAEQAIAKVKNQTLALQIEEARLKMEANETDAEAKREYNALLVEQVQNETEASEKSLEYLNKKRALEMEIREANKQDRAEAKALSTEPRGLSGLTIPELEVVLSDEQALLDAAAKANKRRMDENTKTSIDLQKKKKEATVAAVEATMGVMNQLADLAGKHTVAGKALAIAAALINVAVGITKAIAQGGFLGIAMGAAVAVAGFTAIKSIIDTPVPAGGGGGGTGGVSAPSVSKPVAPPAPTFNVVEGNQDNIRQDALAEDINKPQKAYVVSSEVESQVALDRKVKNNSAL